VALVVAQVLILFWSTHLWAQLQQLAVVVAVCTLFQMIRASAVDLAVVVALMVP
jgi:hypothetical protein